MARDLFWLLGLGLVLIATGLGLRDPWPADEPRFALIARDMVANGQWLFPRVGGDLYADKPPLFMWLIAAFHLLTGSMRVAFLLPSLLAALGTLVLVYDLGRRLWNREAGRWAALALLFTIQFTLQARRAQIDMTLVFFTTLSLYGLLRYLLLGHGMRWWIVGGFAAGLGVITKGVGFLPLLMLAPYAYARRRGWKLPRVRTGRAWVAAPAAMLIAIVLWLAPMLIAVAVGDDPRLAAYRDEILLQQTAGRYADPWHHHRPFWYFLTVMASQWLPLALLLPWLVPRWRERLRAQDPRVLLLLGWIVLVLLFFSISPGKRGVYIFPALPALALLSGEWLRGLSQRADVQRTGAAFAAFMVLLCAAAFVYFTWIDPGSAAELRAGYGISLPPILAGVAILCAAVILTCGVHRGLLATAWVLAILWLAAGLIVAPQINAERSDKRFVAKLERLDDHSLELGLLECREQFLLHLDRPVVNFGHRRWREGAAETHDAARWLNAAPNRQLLAPQHRLSPCFDNASEKVEVGKASRATWYLVRGPAASNCASQGDPARAIAYGQRNSS
jgi:4-amino-4-deoxy-L-arabinose transferase-like glycosyltransferase